MKNLIKAIFIRSSVVIITVVLSLLVFEFFFRLFRGSDSWLKLTVGKIDKQFHHSFKPNTILKAESPGQEEISYTARMNNFGLRGEDISIEKPKGVMRILMVGDSFTFGVGAQDNETIPYYLEGILKKKSGSIEVVNCGMGLLSTTLHYINLRDRYLQLSPDMVILLFDLTDLWDDWELEKNLIYDKNGKILRCDPRYTYGRWDLWVFLRSHSKFARWIDEKIIRSWKKLRILGFSGYHKVAQSGQRAKGAIANLENPRIDPITYDGLFFTRGRKREADIRRHWQRTAKFILMIQDMLKEKDIIGFIMVIYPYGMQVGPNQWSKGRVYWGFEKGRTYTDYFCFELMEEFAKEHNIALINLLPTLLANKDKKLFFDYDGHFTPVANKIAAEAIVSNSIFKEKFSSLLRRNFYKDK